MPLKGMVFIDGSWFYHSRQVLFDVCGEEGFEIDYQRLASLIEDNTSDALDLDVDLLRVCYFGTLPINKPGYNPAKQRTFYEFLAAMCRFETEIVEVDHRVETSVSDDRSVGVALAASAMHYASMPGVLDIVVIVGGNHEYRTLLRRLRALGKRTALVSINNVEGRQATSPSLLTEPGLTDVPTLFLDEHVELLRLVRREQLRNCKLCGAEETTTWAGPEFFCATCRSDHRRRIRVCDTCGREEETTWDKNYFYCSECRRQYRQGKPEEALPVVDTEPAE